MLKVHLCLCFSFRLRSMNNVQKMKLFEFHAFQSALFVINLFKPKNLRLLPLPLSHTHTSKKHTSYILFFKSLFKLFFLCVCLFPINWFLFLNYYEILFFLNTALKKFCDRSFFCIGIFLTTSIFFLPHRFLSDKHPKSRKMSNYDNFFFR